MRTLLKSVEVTDADSKFDGKVVDVLLEDGIIKSIGEIDAKGATVVDCEGLHVSNGWYEMWSHFNDPGEEHKEDAHTGVASAIAGGYTAVSLLPNTSPVVQSKSSLQYLKSKSHGYPTRITPYCAVSLECKGEELTEMIDASHSGAIAFTDGLKPIWHTDVFLKALIYLRKFDGLLINKPEEKWLSQFGSMHEGIVSTTMGLKGMPSVAEEIMIERDLRLLRYAGSGKIHFATISTIKSVELIRKAKAEGLDVTCSVSIWNLIYTDQNVEGYNTAFKLNPPVRSEKDRKALIKALMDNTIDVIVANHQAQDEECKKLEFDLADFGAIGLQTMLPCLLRLTNEIPFKTLIDKITKGPRRVLNVAPTYIAEGEPVDLTIFDMDLSWKFDRHANRSKSTNSPLYDTVLKGKVLGVFLGTEAYIDSKLEQ